MIGAADMANKLGKKIKNRTENVNLKISIYQTNCRACSAISNLSTFLIFLRRDGNSDGITNLKNKNEEENFGYYLTGQIEGDGYISITNTNRIIQGITFNIKDKPLAEAIQKKIGIGFIVKRKTNSIELRFGSVKSQKKIIYLINGKFRTPKIDQFYTLCDWMNKYHSGTITKFPLDTSYILNNSWLTGFIDADGHFYIKYTPNQIQCKFSLEQRMVYPKTQESLKPIISKICESFETKINIRTREGQKNSYYIIRIENQKTVQQLINYLERYPLFSSKYLDYIEWKNTHKQILEKKHLTEEGKSLIKISKSNMNDKRIFFNWDHLYF